MRTKHLSRESESFICSYSTLYIFPFASKCFWKINFLKTITFLIPFIFSSRQRISSRSIKEKMERLAQAAQVGASVQAWQPLSLLKDKNHPQWPFHKHINTNQFLRASKRVEFMSKTHICCVIVCFWELFNSLLCLHWFSYIKILSC